MFNIELNNNESIIVIDYDCKILTKNNIVDALLVLTNMRLLIYIDVNKKMDYLTILQTARNVKMNPNWEKQLDILISNIETIHLKDNVYTVTIDDNILKFISPKIYENNLLSAN